MEEQDGQGRTRKQPKILIVGEAASIHTARYAMMVKGLGYDVRLFSNANNSMQDEHLRDMDIYVPFIDTPPTNGNRLIVPWRIFATFHRPYSWNKQLWISRVTRFFYRRTRARRRLHRVLRRFRPDLIISLKMQEDGYVVAEAKALAGRRRFPKWLHFSWGTDIEYFGKHPAQTPAHLPQIIRLLSLCDYHVADTWRDIESAKQLGFTGKSIGKQIAQGGFDVAAHEPRRTTPFAARNVILVKGRQGGYIGKGMHIIEALHGMRDELQGFEIKIILATADVMDRAAEYSRSDGITYDCVGRLPYQALLDLFGRARITVSATDVDGSPVFLLESMLMGALPVHSDMESIREWVEDGQNGLLFPVNDIAALQDAIRRGLKDAALFEEASRINLEKARAQMDSAAIQAATSQTIESLLRDGQGV